MAKNNLYSDFKQEVKDIEKRVTSEITPHVNRLLKESVGRSLIDWYNDYDQKSYDRTYNFMKILDNTRTSGKGNILTLSVDSGSMQNYSGWNGKVYNNTYTIGKISEKYNGQKLNASIAFDFMFMNGEHGHGKWMKHQSIPPYMYVDRDIESGWYGQLDKLINNKLDKILGK